MEQNKNFNWISSLRGIGAFLVFFSHLPIIFPNDLGFRICYRKNRCSYFFDDEWIFSC